MFIISGQEKKCSVASFPSKPRTLQGDARERGNMKDQQPRGLFQEGCRTRDILSPLKCFVTAPLPNCADVNITARRKKAEMVSVALRVATEASGVDRKRAGAQIFSCHFHPHAENAAWCWYVLSQRSLSQAVYHIIKNT